MRKESSLFFPFPSGSNLSKVTKSREQNKEFILFLPRRSKFGKAKVTNKRVKCERKARFSFHSRVAVTYPKLRKVESKTKNSFFFCRDGVSSAKPELRKVDGRTKKSIILRRHFMFLRQLFRHFPLLVAKCEDSRM